MSVHLPRATQRRFPAFAPIGSGLLLALALTACGGDGDPVSESDPPPLGAAPAGSVSCKDYDGKPVLVKAKTITFYNNSKGTIYPVLATSKNAVNEWIQGCFRVTDPHPTEHVYKLYVNEGKGIPANSSVTITLPLYSEPTKGTYITWWNGGRVVLADKSDRLRNPEDKKLTTPKEVTCKGSGTSCALTTYSSAVQFPENVYAQLSEYTFGDSIIPAGQTLRLLKPENVGYNISYVDHVYMPVAIGPKNNPYIGYSGSTQALATFRSHLSSFLSSERGEGWPVYNLTELKLPGGYNIFAQRSGTLPPTDDVPVKPSEGFPPVLTVLACIEGRCNEDEKANEHFGAAVQRMQNMWASCVNWGSEDVSKYRTESISCPDGFAAKLEAVKAFFVQNHENYLELYKAGSCQGKEPLVPEFNYWQAITHIYGWVPFNEGCGADANKLADTKIDGWDHAKIQSMYIHELQYNHQHQEDLKLRFNPYVELIHDDLQMNAYAFSVDDAVGFMSELGNGLIFTVGGPKGLENHEQFNYANGFSLALGVPKSMEGHANKPLIKKYGVCALGHDPSDKACTKNKQDVIMPDNSQIAGFRVGTVPSYPIKVRFTDLEDNLYTVVVNEKFDLCPEDAENCPTNRDAIVDKAQCQVVNSKGQVHPKSHDWCVNANPNQQREKQLTKNYLSFPQPVGYMN